MKGSTFFSAVALTLAMAGCGGSPPASLGARGGALSACLPTPNCIKSETGGSNRPFVLVENTGQAWRSVIDVTRSQSRTLLRTETGSYAHFEVRSVVFRFVDDLELLWDEAAGVVHYRSASRLGAWDLGVNARRVGRLEAALVERGLIRAPGAS